MLHEARPEDLGKLHSKLMKSETMNSFQEQNTQKRQRDFILHLNISTAKQSLRAIKIIISLEFEDQVKQAINHAPKSEGQTVVMKYSLRSHR